MSALALFQYPIGSAVAVFLVLLSLSSISIAQQVVQRGALGKPAQVMVETGEWTTPLLVAKSSDAEIYISDVSSQQWLKRNYPNPGTSTSTR